MSNYDFEMLNFHRQLQKYPQLGETLPKWWNMRCLSFAKIVNAGNNTDEKIMALYRKYVKKPNDEFREIVHGQVIPVPTKEYTLSVNIVYVLTKGETKIYLIHSHKDAIQECVNTMNFAVRADLYLSVLDGFYYHGKPEKMCLDITPDNCQYLADIYSEVKHVIDNNPGKTLVFFTHATYVSDMLILDGFNLGNYVKRLLPYEGPDVDEIPVSLITAPIVLGIATYAGWVRDGKPSYKFNVIDGSAGFYHLTGFGKTIYMFGDLHLRNRRIPCTTDKHNTEIGVIDFFRIIMDMAQTEGRVLDIYIESSIDTSFMSNNYYMGDMTYIFQLNNMLEQCLNKPCNFNHRIHGIDAREFAAIDNTSINSLINMIRFDNNINPQQAKLYMAYTQAYPYLDKGPDGVYNDYLREILQTRKLEKQLAEVDKNMADQIKFTLENDLKSIKNVTWDLYVRYYQLYSNKHNDIMVRIMDLFTEARMLRKFKDVPGYYSGDQNNILMHAGNTHCKNVANDLVKLGFKLHSGVGIAIENQCASISGIKQPLFSEQKFTPLGNLKIKHQTDKRRPCTLDKKTLEMITYFRLRNLPNDFAYTYDYINNVFKSNNIEAKRTASLALGVIEDGLELYFSGSRLPLLQKAKIIELFEKTKPTYLTEFSRKSPKNESKQYLDVKQITAIGKLKLIAKDLGIPGWNSYKLVNIEVLRQLVLAKVPLKEEVLKEENMGKLKLIAKTLGVPRWSGYSNINELKKDISTFELLATVKYEVIQKEGIAESFKTGTRIVIDFKNKDSCIGIFNFQQEFVSMIRRMLCNLVNYLITKAHITPLSFIYIIKDDNKANMLVYKDMGFHDVKNTIGLLTQQVSDLQCQKEVPIKKPSTPRTLLDFKVIARRLRIPKWSRYTDIEKLRKQIKY